MALYGIDISDYQAVGTIGQDFAIIKATQGTGTGSVQARCDAHYQTNKKAGKLLGVYHFAVNKLNTAVAEANNFVDNTVGYWQAKEAILVLDYEAYGTATNKTAYNDPTNVTWALTWLNQVYARTGVRPLIYMSAAVTGQVDWSPVVNANYGLWVAGYPSRFNVKNPPQPAADGSDFPYSIGAWPFAAIWQYSSGAGTLDVDIAYMTRKSWSAYAGQTAVPPAPVITTQDTTETKEVPFETHTIEDETKEVGYSEITTVGVPGVQTITTRHTYTDGNETSSVVISDAITVAPITQITTVGTKQPEVVVPPVVEPPVVTPPFDQSALAKAFAAIIAWFVALYNSFKVKK